MGSKAFSHFISWPYAKGFHYMLEQPTYCAFYLSFSLSLNKVIFIFVKDVSMYACIWHEYFVILMGLILYAKDLRSCLIQKLLSLLKNCNQREIFFVNFCACVCLKWYFPLWAYTQIVPLRTSYSLSISLVSEWILGIFTILYASLMETGMMPLTYSVICQFIYKLIWILWTLPCWLSFLIVTSN